MSQIDRELLDLLARSVQALIKRAVFPDGDDPQTHNLNLLKTSNQIGRLLHELRDEAVASHFDDGAVK